MMELHTAHFNDLHSDINRSASSAEALRGCPHYLMELSLVLHGPHVASYGQLL